MGEEKEHPWAEAARQLGGDFYPSSMQGGPAVQIRVGQTLVSAHTYGGGLGQITLLQAFYPNPEGFHFSIRNASLSSELGKLLFGMQDIRLGDKRFDMRFVVQGTDEARVRALLGQPRIRELVDGHGALDLAARPLNRWHVNYLGGDADGLSELRYQVPGAAFPERLADAFELFREILEELSRHELADRDEVDVHISHLKAPGGTIPGLRLVLWEGTQLRRAAAVELGHLGDSRAVPALIAALEDEDDELRRAAIGALETLGDPQAIGPLAALLGDGARVAGALNSEHAAQALRELGAGGLVDAFDRALEGDDTALRQQVGEHRMQVAQALLATMEGSDLSAAEAAARALGRLGVREALPGLRTIQRTTGWDRTREAARQAIAELESMASLPRPAGPAEVDHDTLPRAADEPERDVGTLPRSSSPEDREEVN